MRKDILFYVFAAVLLFASCEKEALTSKVDNEENIEEGNADSSSVVIQNEALRELKVMEDDTIAVESGLYKKPLNEDEQSVASSMQQLAMRMIHEISNSKSDGNIVFSPYSMESLLSMTMNGTGGETRTEILNALGGNTDMMPAVNSYNKKIKYHIQDYDILASSKISNSVWVQYDNPVYNSFVSTVSNLYDASVVGIDFHHKDAAKAINDWSSKATEGLIDNIMQEDPGSYKLYLANSFYMNAGWIQSFQKKNTKVETFTNADGTVSEVDMMNNIDSYRFLECADYDVIRLFLGGCSSMTVYLPHEGVSIEKCLEELTVDAWKVNYKNNEHKYLDFKLPRFAVSQRWSMKGLAGKMGISSIFADDADFSSLTTGSVKMDDIFQDVKIEIDEEGCIAAAVSHGSMATVNGEPGTKPTPIPFYVNRPFFYTIQSEEHGVILYAGVVRKL